MIPDGKLVRVRSAFHLVRSRLGRHERALLLAANPDTWTPIPGWRTDRKRLSVISRVCTRLENLKLIERHYDDRWEPWTHRDDSNSKLVVRRDPNGYENSYRLCVGEHSFKLTPLGAAVVEQFHDELTTGRRIRWSRFDSSSLPPLPPEPDKLTPEQEELQQLKNSLRWWMVQRDFSPSCIDTVRRRFEELPQLEANLENWQRTSAEWERRCAELEAAGVTLTPPESDEIADDED